MSLDTTAFAPLAKKALLGAALIGAVTMSSGCGALISGIQQAQQESQGAPEAPDPATDTPVDAPSDPAATDVPAEEEDVAAFDIAVGDCLNDESIVGEVSEVPLTECSSPHDSEVYASTTSSATTWPGEDGMAQEAQEFCEAEFATFIGVSIDQSIYQFSYYTPTQEAFDAFDREISCVVSDPSGQTTGSLAGVAQ
ncbi:septum formation family protein [Nocardiopsis potens]|uniref:septum formation family protein n=1 Tax=Nocardiopsis potens TaxID=1246458 RepID=UPI00034772EE|nr:septum formation family protein [Nocardiopsis potens]